MPIYEYRCKRGHAFECLQRMGADAVDSCTVCGAVATRVFSAPAVHFKGSGFYTTDYGKKSRGGSENGNGANGESGTEKKDSGEKKDSKDKKETKTEPKATAPGASSD